MAGSVRFALTTEDLIAGQRLYLRRSIVGRRNLVLCGVLLGVMAALLACRSFPRVAWLGDFAAAPIGALIGLLLCQTLGFMLIPHRARRSVRQQPGLLEEASWTWDDVGIETQSDGGSARFKWRELYRSFTGRRTFLLNPQTRLIYILPRRVFDPEQQRELEGLLVRFARARGRA